MAEQSVRANTSPATAGEVFALVRDAVATTRSEIGRRTGLSRTAVAARVSALVRHGLVKETAQGPSTGGRPPVRLVLDAAGGVVLSGAIGRTRTQLAVCDLAGDVLATRDLEQEVGAGPADLMPKVGDGLEALLLEVARPTTDVLGVGLSIPGTVDQGAGCSLDSPVMPGWDGVVLEPYLAPRFGCRVLVDNDANAMALSEHRGHLERFDDLLMIKASTGLGAGVVSGSVLQRGALGAAGELGHIKLHDAAGVACRCGDTGCLEAVAGGWALVVALQQKGRQVTHVRDLVALALDGDAEARRLIRSSGRRLGEVLAGVVNLLNPAALVVGGDMAPAYDALAAGLRESVYGNATALATRQLQILPATHGGRSGVVGCAAQVLERVLSARAVDLSLAGAQPEPSRSG